MIKPRVIISMSNGQVQEITHNILDLEVAICDFDTMGVFENQLTSLQWPDESPANAIVTKFLEYKSDGHLTTNIWNQLSGDAVQIDQQNNKKWHCKKCGGTNVEIRTWLDANSGDSRDEEIEDKNTWCRECQDNTGVILKE